MTPEGRVKAMVNKRLAALSKVWKFMPVQNGMGIPGLDYFLCVSGRFVALETKVKGKTLTPRQETTKAQIEAAGGLVFVVDDAESLETAIARVALAIDCDPRVDPYTQSYTPAED